VRVDRYATVLGGRMLLEAGIPLAISSDHPSGPLDPLHDLRAAAGGPADFVVCDGDPFAPGTRVTQTWIAGEQAWPATAGGQPSR
jgi:predicted amidohydrolase YtcJ